MYLARPFILHLLREHPKICCDASIVVTHFAFCFASCVVMIAFHLQQLSILLSVLLVVIKTGIGTIEEVSRL